MSTSRIFTALPLAGLLLLTACQGGEPTAPFADDDFLTEEDAIALDVLSFDGAIEAALAVAYGPVEAMGRHGRGYGHGAGVAAANDAIQARLRFQEAVRLMENHDSTGALVRAREARRLVARAGQSAVGGRFAVGAAERIEAMLGWIEDDPGFYHDPMGLFGELNRLAEQARLRLHQHDSLGAGELRVLAEQRVRQRSRDGEHGFGLGNADISVALGASAVALATRLLDEQGADDEQLRYLEAAVEYQRAAEAALDAGWVGRAIHLSDLAEWAALKAVVLPGGVTVAETYAMLELAESLYAEAAAGELSERETILLQRARAMMDHAIDALASGSVRPVVPLWRASVICFWIAG
ncbi:MAG TPA: hypothetical protein VLA36_01675 [Longimicrobiales bacterium]|nr:hypothetical protein [Longimicrobiales bacterium]